MMGLAERQFDYETIIQVDQISSLTSKWFKPLQKEKGEKRKKVKANVRIPIQSSFLSRSCEKANWRLSTKLPPSRRGHCGLDKTNRISNPEMNFQKK